MAEELKALCVKADDLRDAVRLLERVSMACDPRGEGIDEHECQSLVIDADAFLARTSRNEAKVTAIVRFQ